MTGADGGAPYKVVEISDVVDAEIENALNRWTRDGYRFESIQFVTQPGSRRPAMAYLVFRRRDGAGENAAPPGAGGKPPRRGRRG